MRYLGNHHTRLGCCFWRKMLFFSPFCSAGSDRALTALSAFLGSGWRGERKRAGAAEASFLPAVKMAARCARRAGPAATPPPGGGRDFLRRGGAQPRWWRRERGGPAAVTVPTGRGGGPGRAWKWRRWMRMNGSTTGRATRASSSRTARCVGGAAAGNGRRRARAPLPRRPRVRGAPPARTFPQGPRRGLRAPRNGREGGGPGRPLPRASPGGCRRVLGPLPRRERPPGPAVLSRGSFLFRVLRERAGTRARPPQGRARVCVRRGPEGRWNGKRLMTGRLASGNGSCEEKCWKIPFSVVVRVYVCVWQKKERNVCSFVTHSFSIREFEHLLWCWIGAPEHNLMFWLGLRSLCEGVGHFIPLLRFTLRACLWRCFLFFLNSKKLVK